MYDRTSCDRDDNEGWPEGTVVVKWQTLNGDVAVERRTEKDDIREDTEQYQQLKTKTSKGCTSQSHVHSFSERGNLNECIQIIHQNVY